MQAKFLCDLHGHTNRSDGNDSPAEFIKKAAERGMKVIAITDHDISPLKTLFYDGKSIDIAAYAKDNGILLINGIEISCETEIEDVHLVCFGCDWNHRFFQKLEEITRKNKDESYRRFVELLALDGMEISFGELLGDQGNPKGDKQIQKKMIFELLAEKGYAKSWKDAKIMVKQNAKFCVNRRKPNAVDIINQIHQMNGIVILAHPYLIAGEVCYQNKAMNRSAFMEQLISAGLDGIEASYPYDKTSYSGAMTSKEIYDEVIRDYGKRGLIISGGSDYHADGKKGTINPREIGECGITVEEFNRYEKLVNLVNK